LKYVIYSAANGSPQGLYEGDSPPSLTPNLAITDAEFDMCKTNISNFKVVSGKLVPLANQLFVSNIRKQRDSLLDASDKYMTSDFPLAPGKLDQWKAYRQALRDLTKTIDPANPVFPIPPN